MRLWGWIRRRRPSWPGEKDRITYQRRYVAFDIQPGERVLDVGSGGYPFPYASVLVDRFRDESPTRREPLVTARKPFVVSEIHQLPFGDKAFDFVYCSHVLEVVEDPVMACQEIMRVGARGFIETPTLGTDTLFAWARGLQKWHVVGIGETLCFFEYSERQLDGIKSSAWRDRILSKRYDPLQEIFYENQDVFNVMFTWTRQFAVYCFRLDGSVKILNAR